MSMSKEQILAEAMTLKPHERAELWEDLRQVVEDGELSPEQIAELRRRVEAVDRGDMPTIPGDQVMQELFRHLKRR